jgi:NAD(P)-dependent dehydrogenase (short-subunit alcohol dehydrogenase family)
MATGRILSLLMCGTWSRSTKRLIMQKNTFGRLDVLVNNAGGAPHTDAATASPRFSEKIIALNLLAPLNFAQAANRIMQQQADGGVIINIASVSGERPSPGTAAYGAAKAGLLNLTKSLAVEWAPKVRVVGITCGMIRTEQAHLHYGDEAGIASVEATVPLIAWQRQPISGMPVFLWHRHWHPISAEAACWYTAAAKSPLSLTRAMHIISTIY